MRTAKHQHWILLGTAPASEEVWGLRSTEFPCGYLVPFSSFVNAGSALIRPGTTEEVWVMGGFALEIAHGGKDISKEQALGYVGGYRPWIALFHDVLIDELVARKHTVTVWDRGVSIFYGLWQEAGQALGELIPAGEFQRLLGCSTRLETELASRAGVSASAYAHDAASIISFMSTFMTLSAGDIYIQGPLVALRLACDSNHVALSAGEMRFEVCLA